MKTRILVLSSLVLVFGCDKVERDESKCNFTNKCTDNRYICVYNRCMLPDAGPDTATAVDGSVTAADAANDRPTTIEARPEVAREGGSDAEADVPLAVVDAPTDLAVDAPAVDGPRSCGEDQDCPADAPLCLNSVCVQCRSHEDCADPDGGVDDRDGGGPSFRGAFCNLKNQCVGCLSHGDCRVPGRPVCSADQSCVACGETTETACASRNPALPVCSPTSGNCVQCVRPTDCKAKATDAGVGDAGVAGGVCSAQNTCVECNGASDCTADPAKAFCVGNACVGCGAAGTGACTGSKPLCLSAGSKAGQCVECTSSTQCLKAASPLCDDNQCRGCKKDSECSAQAGICALDGSCPKASAVVYAQNTSKCTSSDRGKGTLDFPYCDLDKAVSAAILSGSVVRILGTITASKALVIDASKSPLLISGQSATTAIINAPSGSSDPIVSITGGEVTLRDLTVSGGRAAGISTSAGTLRVARCYVLDNADTGIAVGNGVAFDIANTVIAGNTRSGVTLGTYTGSGPARFDFNTVVNNGDGGVVCPAMGRSLTGVLAYNNGPFNINPNCITTPTTSTAAPLFGSNFHLTAASPCVNAGGSTCPVDDIDGDARPKGLACDCGADEF